MENTQVRTYEELWKEVSLVENVRTKNFLTRLLKEAEKEKAQRKALEFRVICLKQIIGELNPKIDYIDLVLKGEDLLTSGQIADYYGMRRTNMNYVLMEEKILEKQDYGQWILCPEYQGMGFTKSETFYSTKNGREVTILKIKWTKKGRLFIYDMLKRVGMLPLIEQK